MITVACVYKTGGDFGPAYVKRLGRGIHANLGLEHKFICLSDGAKDLADCPDLDDVEPLQHEWPGWWAKMELFGLKGPILYFDLDTVITGSIDDLVLRVMSRCYQGSLFLLRDFHRGNEASGILGWDGDLRWILQAFIRYYVERGRWQRRGAGTELIAGRDRFRGDQEWLRAFLPSYPNLSRVFIQDVMPGVYSYKLNIRNGDGLPSDAAVVCFHGRPRPHEVKPQPEWLRQHWRESNE